MVNNPVSLCIYWNSVIKAGIKTIRFDKDSIVALLGRFIVAPVLMFLLKLMAPGMVTAEYQTFYNSVCYTGLSGIANLSKPRMRSNRATNTVTLSTVLFVIVIPILQTIIDNRSWLTCWESFFTGKGSLYSEFSWKKQHSTILLEGRNSKSKELIMKQNWNYFSSR